MTTDDIEIKELMHNFKNSLEEVLDEYFPKIYEEGEAKRANKRGPALVLFSEAMCLAEKMLAEYARTLKKTQ